jgi:hypothetical protein
MITPNSKKTRQVRHVACMGERRNTYISIGITEEKKPL